MLNVVVAEKSADVPVPLITAPPDGFPTGNVATVPTIVPGDVPTGNLPPGDVPPSDVPLGDGVGLMMATV